MALLICPDCGHRVSHRALACPQCAGPITSAEPPPVLESTPPDSNDAPVQTPERKGGPVPATLAAWHGELRAARASAAMVTKRCARCGLDVAADFFRAKSGAGYLCGECAEADDRRRFVVAERTRKFFIAAAVIVLIATMTTLAVAVGASRAAHPAAPPR